MTGTTAGLRIEALSAGYGRMTVLRGLSLHVEPGELVAVLGRNGAGKTTLLRTVAGLERPRGGVVELDGRRLGGRRPWRVARSGVSSVLEGARLFATQSVADNLAQGLAHSRDRDRGRHFIEMLTERFPVLRDRRDAPAGALSGGERMQVAIAQALAAAPRLLLLDEPSVGLSPVAVRSVFDLLDEVRRETGAAALAVLVAEQMVAPVLRVADRAVVLDGGGIAARGTAAELRDTPALTETYLGTPGDAGGP